MNGFVISALGFGFALHAILAAEGGKKAPVHMLASLLFLIAGIVEILA